ncbi:glycosyltransferase [Gracilibacillus sp. HCP3S3_G5_1]|uniref:glycosyltransferase n=1 Tax=unclassified Gracilibacillus TaxID=2625209 RepID=UPI003F8B8272
MKKEGGDYMPTSWIQAIPEIMEEVERFKPNSILDIGIGFGKYGVLLRESLELPYERYSKSDWKVRLDGVEAFTNYKNPIHEHVYDKVYYRNVTECIDRLPDYDVVLLVDVLEHFDKEEGKEILKRIMKHTKKALIISTPLYPDVQGEYLSNKYEEHKSRWYQVDFADYDFDYKLLRIGKNGAQIFIIQPPAKTQRIFPIDNISTALKKRESKNLTIGYFLPHKNLTGGLKMLLEQMKHLRKLGHKVYAYYKGQGQEGDGALPPWMRLQVDKEIIVPKEHSFASYLDDCDIGVCGWLDQMEELSNVNIPVVYWEQGNEYLFGQSLNENLRSYLERCYQQPVALTSVSPMISTIIESRFGRKAPVIPNGIDTDFYYPGKRPNENSILLVGNPNLMFKGFDVALQTLIRVWRAGYKFKVKWVCQVKPSLDQVPFPFPIEYVVTPTQEELAKYYRHSDIFLFTSWFEGYGMPPLEAMASGVPVVSTSCGGIDVYAQNGVNCILADPGDIDQLAKGVIYFLNDEQARDNFSEKGRDTALRFSYSKVIEQLENYLYSLAHYKDTSRS